MKRLLTFSRALLVTAALCTMVSSAHAQGGMNLSWNDCGVFGLPAVSFACDTNNGANVLITSAMAPKVVAHLNAAEIVVDLQSNTAVLSDWWNLGTGGCRVGSYSGNAIFSGGPFNCVDPWLGNASGGVDYAYGYGGPNRARMRGVFAVAGTVAIDNITEYYISKFIINNAKSTGAGACAGCGDGVCIVLNQIKLSQPSTFGYNPVITTPLLRNYVTWQGGNPTGGCPGATPTRNNTWGSVKSLYR